MEKLNQLAMQNSYLISKEGTLDEEFREAVTTAIVAVKDLPGMGRYWRQRRGFFHAGSQSMSMAC